MWEHVNAYVSISLMSCNFKELFNFKYFILTFINNLYKQHAKMDKILMDIHSNHKKTN